MYSPSSYPTHILSLLVGSSSSERAIQTPPRKNRVSQLKTIVVIIIITTITTTTTTIIIIIIHAQVLPPNAQPLQRGATSAAAIPPPGEKLGILARLCASVKSLLSVYHVPLLSPVRVSLRVQKRCEFSCQGRRVSALVVPSWRVR